MVRVILAFISMLFLFVGIAGSTNAFLKRNISSEQKLVAQAINEETVKSSIRDIEIKTAENNLPFTYKNALR